MGRIRFIAPQYSELGQKAQARLYPALGQALAGGGFTPDIDEATRSAAGARLKTEFLQERRDLGSFIERTIPRADIGVRRFMKQSLAAQYARGKESIGREGEFRAFQDIEPAQNIAFGALGSELGLASEYSGMMNQYARTKEDAPDFGGQLASGLGGAAGIYMAGRNRTPQTETMNVGNVRNFQSLDPGYAGIRYASNFSSASYSR